MKPYITARIALPIFCSLFSFGLFAQNCPPPPGGDPLDPNQIQMTFLKDSISQNSQSFQTRDNKINHQINFNIFTVSLTERENPNLIVKDINNSPGDEKLLLSGSNQNRNSSVSFLIFVSEGLNIQAEKTISLQS